MSKLFIRYTEVRNNNPAVSSQDKTAALSVTGGVAVEETIHVGGVLHAESGINCHANKLVGVARAEDPDDAVTRQYLEDNVDNFSVEIGPSGKFRLATQGLGPALTGGSGEPITLVLEDESLHIDSVDNKLKVQRDLSLNYLTLASTLNPGLAWRLASGISSVKEQNTVEQLDLLAPAGTPSVTIRGDGSATFYGKSRFLYGLSAGGAQITDLATPVLDTDACTKGYTDSVAQGLDLKDSVVAATTTAGDLATAFAAGTQLDGITLVTGQRILLKDQTDAKQNGIYIVKASGPPQRAVDMRVNMKVNGAYTFVEGGTINKGNGYCVTSAAGSDVVGVDALNFTQFSGAGMIITGNALSKAGNRLDVVIDNISLQFTPGSSALRIASGALSTGLSGGSGTAISVNANLPHVTGLGTVTSGVWNASTVTVPFGGTGAVSLASDRFLLGSGTAPISAISDVTYDRPSTTVRAINLFTSGANYSPVFYIGSSQTTPQGGALSLTATAGAQFTNSLINDLALRSVANLRIGSASVAGSASSSLDILSDGTIIGVRGNDSSSLATGSVRLNGGIAVGMSLNVGLALAVGWTGITNGTISASRGSLMDIIGNTFLNTATAASATSADFTTFRIGQTTIASSATGVKTVNASSLYIAGPPIAGANTTITNRTAISVASGAVIINDVSTAIDKTSGALVVKGGVGISGDLFTGGAVVLSGTYLAVGGYATVGGTLSVLGTTSLANTTLIATTVNPSSATGGSLNVAGDIVLGVGGDVLFSTGGAGVGPPTAAARSVGSKLVLYPSVGTLQLDYAIGIENGTMWNSILDGTSSYKWYAGATASGATNIMTLAGSGNLTLNSALNQPLTAYVRNVNTGSSTYAALSLGNDTGLNAVLFLNSSTRTADGPANSTVLRNDAGDLYLLAKGGAPNSSGIRIAATTGFVTIPLNLSVTQFINVGGGGTSGFGSAASGGITFEFVTGGGYKHFVRSRHDAAGVTTGNAIDIYLNTATTAIGSTAPGTGNTLGMSITATGVSIPNPLTAMGPLIGTPLQLFANNSSAFALTVNSTNPSGGVVPWNFSMVNNGTLFANFLTFDRGNVSLTGGFTAANTSFVIGGTGLLKTAINISDYTIIGTNVTDGTTNTRIVLSGTTRTGGYAGNIDYIACSTGKHVFSVNGGSIAAMTISEVGQVTIGNNVNISGSLTAAATTLSSLTLTYNSTPLIMTANVSFLGSPTFTTRSPGTKLVLWPGLSATTSDYAFGIDSGTLWSSVPATDSVFKWYGGTTNAMTLTGSGDATIGKTLTVGPNGVQPVIAVRNGGGIALTIVNSTSASNQTSLTLQNSVNGTTGYLGLDGNGLQAFTQDALTLFVNNGKPIQLLTSSRIETNAPIIMTNASLFAAPTFTTRSIGTKLVLYGGGVTATNVEYALGIEGSTLWSSVPATSSGFKWYTGTTNAMTLSGDGNGIRQASSDGAIITKGWEPFTSGKYYSANFPVSSYGLFMEPSALTVGGRNLAGKLFQVVGYNLDSTLVQRLSVDLGTGATIVSGTIGVVTPGTGYVTSASFMQPNMATGFANSITLGQSGSSLNCGILSFVSVGGTGSTSNVLKLQLSNQQSGLSIRGDGSVLADANLYVGNSQNVGTISLGNQGTQSAGVVLADPAHSIYLRYNYAGTVNTVAHYSYGDIQFFTNGLIAAQTMKMSIAASGSVSVPAGSLSVSGNITAGGYAMIGTSGGGSSTVPNMLGFTGTSGDSSVLSSMQTAIVDRIYAGTEASELLFFKGNDVAGASGPDVVRIAAAEFYFDALSAAGSYNYTTNTLPAVTRRFTVTLTSSTLAVPLSITDTSANALQVSGGVSIAGALNVTGTSLNFNTSDNSCLAFDGAGVGRFGFVKQAGFPPKILAANGSNVIIGFSNQSNLTTNVAGGTVTDVMTVGSSGVGILSSLTVNGTVSGPTISSLNNTLVAYEDGSQQTLNSGFVSGAAVYQPPGGVGQIQLSTGTNTSGSLNWQANPGNSWSCDFEMWQDNGNDGIAIGLYQNSIMTDCYANNGGYAVAFNQYRNAVLLAIPSVSRIDVGVANITTLSNNMSSFYAFNTWNSISIKFQSGTLSVFYNGALVGTYKGLPEVSAINRQGTFVSFAALSNTAAMYVRNIRVVRGSTQWESVPSTTSDIRYRAGSVTLGSMSIATNTWPTSATGGALNMTGDVVLAGSTSKIFFTQSGVSAPTKTNRSIGTKLVLWPAIGADSTDYAVGIENGTLWHSVPTTGDRHKWYSGDTNIMTLSGDGNLGLFNTSSPTTAIANRPISMSVYNYSSGNSAFTAFQAINDTGSGIALFLNSSTRTADGPANGAILRNDAGSLYIAAKGTGTKGISVAGVTGTVTIDNGIVASMGSEAGQFRAISGDYGVILRNDGTNFYMLSTPAGSALGTWSGNRPLTYTMLENLVRSDSVWTLSSTASNALQVTGGITVGQSISVTGGVSVGQSLNVAGGVNFTGNTPTINCTGSVGPLNIDPNFASDSYVRIYDRLAVAGSCDVSGALSTAAALTVSGTASVNGNLSTSAALTVSGNATINGELYSGANGWIRKRGSSGLYWEDFGGGWTMTDSTYMRCYGDKVIYTAGAILAGGDVTAYSDARLKENVETIRKPVELVKCMRGVTFTRKDKNGAKGIGLIAQELEAVVPEVVHQDTGSRHDGVEGLRSVAYGNLVGVLVEAIKELVARIEKLEAS